MPPLGLTDDNQFSQAARRLRQALAAGATDSKGALRVGATQRYFPALTALEKTLSVELGRKTTVRIFSRAGYDLVKSETDIMGA